MHCRRLNLEQVCRGRMKHLLRKSRSRGKGSFKFANVKSLMCRTASGYFGIVQIPFWRITFLQCLWGAPNLNSAQPEWCLSVCLPSVFEWIFLQCHRSARQQLIFSTILWGQKLTYLLCHGCRLDIVSCNDVCMPAAVQCADGLWATDCLSSCSHYRW